MDIQPVVDWASPISQLATAGGFSALVWYLVVKHIPAIEARHQKERAEWLEYIRHRDDSFEHLTTEHLKETSLVSQQLTGVKDRLGDIEDAISK